MRRAGALLAAWLLVGSIGLTHGEGASSLDPTPPEAAFGALASGSSAGLNGTRATATVAGTLLATTTSLWHLNNTNATGTYVAKIDVVSSSGVANLVSLTVGINNGTSTPQVVGSLGALTQTGGSYVTLPAGSASALYVTRAVSLVGATSFLSMAVTVADDATGDAYYVMQANLTVA